MEPRATRWPAAGVGVFIVALASVAAAVFAPLPILIVAVGLGAFAAIGREAVGRARIPSLIACAVAVVASASMLLISLDVPPGEQCPDAGCSEQLVPEPG